jgi:elongation factor P--(R)-beta-lysine ligase
VAATRAVPQTRRAVLEMRGKIIREIRQHFNSWGFLEVSTPARVRSPGQEVHLDAIGAGEGQWLITSPEYHLKRLVAEGLGPLFEIARCWRADESGPHHRSEFTMLEWYRVNQHLEVLAADCEVLIRIAFEVARRDPSALGFREPFARTTVRDLFAEHAGFALRGDETAEELRAAALNAGVAVGAATAWDDIFYQVFLDRIEPVLAKSGPTFVLDWPAPLGALARPHPLDPRVVERFELYAGGLELANAFGELTDPVEQRRRFEEEARTRAARGKAVYPIDEALLEALPRMPPTAGIALGLDRLIMLALGARDISEVVAF